MAIRQRLIRYPDGSEKHWEEKNMVLVPDVPITLSRSIKIGDKSPLVQQEFPEFIHLVLSEEFESLKDKTVELHGHFVEPSTSLYFNNDIAFNVDTAIDIEWQKNHATHTVFYEPNITELQGIIYQKTYTDSIANDTQAPTLILSLMEPLNVLLAESEEDSFNQPELAVREIHISFTNDSPPAPLWDQGIIVNGTLYSAHTEHHHRRVLMTVNSWKPCPLATK